MNHAIEVIQTWKDREAVVGRDVNLSHLGYARFFALGEDCSDWSFSVFYAKEKQKLVMDLRKEFNELVRTLWLNGTETTFQHWTYSIITIISRLTTRTSRSKGLPRVSMIPRFNSSISTPHWKAIDSAKADNPGGLS
jgi:hypothetical protein